MKSFVLLFGLIFLFLAGKSQGGHSDWKEMGLGGKVRQLTTRAYFSVVKSGDSWMPEDADAYDGTRTYFFNPYGRLDSMHYAEKGAPVKRVIYRYHMGKKSGYDEFEGAVTTESANITWIDSLSFTIRIENFEDGSNTHIWQTLAPDFRDFKSEIRVFDEGGTTVFCSQNENKISSSQVNGALTTDCRSGQALEKRFLNKNPDPAGNATLIIQTIVGNDTPEVVLVREIQYY